MTTHKKGLSSKQVASLRAKYGFNEVLEKKTSFWIQFLKKFIEPIPLMIEFALILSAFIKRWEDFYIILVLLIVNLTVESVESFKAKKALSALTKNLALTAQVIRNGKFIDIPARELVPGDVVKLAIGDIAPADLMLLDDTTIEVDQSAITGESLPVDIAQGEPILSGAIIQKGSALAKVTAIGSATSIGESVVLVAKAEEMEESHFQKAILNIGRFLIIFSVVLVAIASTTLLLRGEPILETLRFAIILIIASIPVALPTVLSVTMAIGAATLAKHKAIVSNFMAVEELAGTEELCIDKTGTLTKNAIEAYPPTLYADYTEEELYMYALLAAEIEDHSPIERALFAYAAKQGYKQESNTCALHTFIPFDPERKIAEAHAVRDGVKIHVVMGASQVIAHMLPEVATADHMAKVDAFATDGFRTLSVAIQENNGEYAPIGIIPLIDPPRDDSKEVIAAIKEHGINIKMLTGDNHAIATYTGRLLNIGKNILPISKLRALFAKNDESTYQGIKNADVCSEVVPADKYYIVETLQSHGHIVAMTGDGVNDAPALKKANVGIAVHGATTAAQKAADLVLLQPSLATIKTAIELSRATFAHMEAYALFRISETVRIVIFITLALIFFESSPITAAMIVILALLNDIPVLAISYDNVPELKKPIRWQMKEMLIVATVLGFLGVVSSFGLYYFLHVQGVAIAVLQTLIFIKLDVAGHSTLYLTRVGRKHFWERPFPSLTFFLPAFGSRIIGTLIAYLGIFMTPISLSAIAFVWIYATVWFVFNDFVKVATYRIIDHYKK